MRLLLPTLAMLFLLPSPAWARPCGPIESCTVNGVENAMSLAVLRERHRGSTWARKHCGCDLHGGDPPSTSRASTVILSDSMPAPAPPPANRDPKGRLGPTPAPAQNIAALLADDGPFSSDLGAAAERYKLPVHLLRAVMQIESGGNPLALSNKGAVGLMQLLPGTARALGVDDIHDTAQNVLGGARFLRILANRFDGDLVKVLSAYHAGSMRVAGRDATPFAATDDYVRKILRLYYQLRDVAQRRG